MINRFWQAMWFKGDDDNTSQGKLAKGCFYLIYWVVGFAILSGIIHSVFDK